MAYDQRNANEGPGPAPGFFSRLVSSRAFSRAALLVIPCTYVLILVLLSQSQPEVFASRYWELTILGVFAAIIATSTPVGGAIVFFPVLVRVGLTPEQAVVFSFAIQTMGMGMGSVTWIEKRVVPVRPIAGLMPWGLVGFGIGLFLLHIDSVATVRIVFSSVGLALSLFLIKIRFRLNRNGKNTDSLTGSPKLLGLLVLVGGWLSAQIGFGVDLVVFFGLWVYGGARVRVATAISVCLMATISLAGFAYHGLVVGDVLWPLWIWAVPGVLLGGRIGPWINMQVGGRGILFVLSLLLIAEFVTTMLKIVAS